MQLPRAPQAVIFDMDGLLIDTIPIYLAAMVQAGVDVGHPVQKNMSCRWLAFLVQNWRSV